MENEFIPYEQALELKELGFDEPCFATYEKLNESILIQDATRPFVNTNSRLSHFEDQEGYIEQCTAPLYQQAFRFFRENYPDLDFGFGKIYNGTNKYHYHINLVWEFFEGTYEEAELACLKKLIEIVKNK